MAGRRPELALRAALGARRRDLLRQLLVETGVLALLGGALGLFVAFAGVRALLALGPARMPRAAEIGIDLPILAFNLALSIVAGLALGLAPAIQGSRGIARTLSGMGRGNTGGRRSTRARAVLVAAEVGLSLVLLVGAGLLLRTLQRLQATDPGFRADHLLSVQLSLPKSRYGRPEAISRFAEQVTARLSSLPGVDEVSAASLNPLTQWRANISFLIEGRPDQDRAKAPLANYRAVAPGYFHTLGVPLREGRDVGPHDTADSVPVVLVSETFARRHFPDSSPLGARLQIDDRDPWRTVEIVGVVGDVKFTGLDAEGAADVYVPYPQTPPDVSVWLANIFCIALRTRGEPATFAPAVRREIRTLDADVAASAVKPMEEALDESLAERRFQTVLLEVFGAAALALALAGIYAVTAFAVVERTREIGVRLSLGSSRGRILGLVARQSLWPVGAGLVCGAAAALALGRLVSGLLFGIAANDASTLIGSAAVLGLAAARREHPARPAGDAHRPGPGPAGGVRRRQRFGEVGAAQCGSRARRRLARRTTAAIFSRHRVCSPIGISQDTRDDENTASARAGSPSSRPRVHSSRIIARRASRRASSFSGRPEVGRKRSVIRPDAGSVAAATSSSPRGASGTMNRSCRRVRQATTFIVPPRAGTKMTDSRVRGN